MTYFRADAVTRAVMTRAYELQVPSHDANESSQKPVTPGTTRCPRSRAEGGSAEVLRRRLPFVPVNALVPIHILAILEAAQRRASTQGMAAPRSGSHGPGQVVANPPTVSFSVVDTRRDAAALPLKQFSPLHDDSETCSPRCQGLLPPDQAEIPRTCLRRSAGNVSTPSDSLCGFLPTNAL